ncbi:DsbA family protein [Pseudoalteromonas luteoviolacea]|nr:DsbA family protein [Pseudoalteromonas luteoviolacea]
MRFLYVMDPMCGWCFGFQPELEQFLSNYPAAENNWVMGGLAPDTDQPMPEELRQTISSYWYEIEKKSQVIFNHDYWQLNTPYRATYLACRAVIAAERLQENSAQKMAKAIQSAYYQQAKNPSLQETLVACAYSIEIDGDEFLKALNYQETEVLFQQHLSITQQLRVSGFPALFYINEENQAYPLTLGFCHAALLEQRFSHIIEN